MMPKGRLRTMFSQIYAPETSITSLTRFRDVSFVSPLFSVTSCHILDAIWAVVLCRTYANQSVPMFRQLVYSLETSMEVAHTLIINVYARTYERLMNRHRRWRTTAIFQEGGGDSYHCSYPRYIRRKIILSGSVLMSAVYRSKYVWSPCSLHTVYRPIPEG